ELTATARNEDGSVKDDADIKWTSENPEIATVDDNGRVTARMTGLALIVAAAVGCEAETLTVAVDPEVSEVRVTPEATTIAVGENETFTVAVLDAGGTEISDPPVTWSSTNPDVASIDDEGRVDAVAPGSAGIVATVGGVADTADIVVT